MTENAHSDHSPNDTAQQPAHETVIDRQVPRIRYIFILPIIALFVAAVVLLVVGFIETFRVILEATTHGEGHVLETLRLHFVELIDVFLLGTILYMIASGFYQLFVGRPLNIAPWLRVDSVHDLEVMLLGVVITLLAVTALAAVMSWDGTSNLLQVGGSVALVIAALAYFLGRSSH